MEIWQRVWRRLGKAESRAGRLAASMASYKLLAHDVTIDTSYFTP